MNNNNELNKPDLSDFDILLDTLYDHEEFSLDYRRKAYEELIADRERLVEKLQRATTAFEMIKSYQSTEVSAVILHFMKNLAERTLVFLKK